LPIHNRKFTWETFEYELRRDNPGGQFEPANGREVIERARETRKITRKVKIPEVLDLSVVTEGSVVLKKMG
jgi:hypothetical protein